MRKGLFTPAVVVVAALSISVPSAPVAFAAITQTGPPAGAVIQADPTPHAASLGTAVISKAGDITALAKKAPRKRRTRR